jgi:hypothetical protein
MESGPTGAHVASLARLEAQCDRIALIVTRLDRQGEEQATGDYRVTVAGGE